MNNDFVAILLALFITLYGLNLAKMKLPGYIKNLFTNPIFNIVFLSLLMIMNFKSAPHVALIIAIIFVLTTEFIKNDEVKENMAYMENYKTLRVGGNAYGY